MVGFDTIWKNIEQFAGQTFATTGGQPFAYEVTDEGLSVMRSDVFLSKEDIRDTFSMKGNVKSKQLVAYINAVLNDSRIRS